MPPFPTARPLFPLWPRRKAKSTCHGRTTRQTRRASRSAGTTGASATTYNDTGLTFSTTYYYRVCANNGAGNSAYSNVSSATTFPTATPFFYESGGAAAWEAEHYHQLNANGDSMVWTEWNTRAGYYHTGYMSTTDSGTTSGGWASAAECLYRVNFATTGAYYIGVRRYAVTAGLNYRWGIDGASVVATEATTTVTAWTWARSATTFNIATAGQHTINIRRRQDGFAIDRIMISTSSSNIPTDTSTGPIESAQTPTPPIAVPGAPGGLNAVKDGTNPTSQINLTWADGSTDESGFKIERSLNGTSGWVQIATTASNIASYQDAGLSAGTTYYYRVCAYNQIGNSTYASVASAATDPLVQPAAPIITVSSTDASLLMSFPTVVGKSYILKQNTATPQLSDAGWTTVGGLPVITGDGATKSFTVAKPASGKIFYTVEYTQ